MRNSSFFPHLHQIETKHFSPNLNVINLNEHSSNYQVTAVLKTTVELKITTFDNSQIALTIAQEATKNLWQIKKYLDAYIAHLQGALTENELDEISENFITKKNELNEEELKICCSYLIGLLPDIDIDDIAMLLNVDFESLTNLFDKLVKNDN